ncbi:MULTISPECIES: PspA/IM30 family protein [unclassified Streptomyces]|uniref:PspA/IM30 family protein n=1 Tax=unclassified Streptomyces TaxID=2593676 RepID=UPI0001C1CF9A|nr:MULTISPECIES: PspA/IM30 family protein [unclassified Streptomyces]AEN12164.1 phage shock protein A, PspA [Streptomyces sp. SirexAA-E]MYR68127.1 PspA/IM30 family protein [Streptomyces sp. SID4939]MYR99856.1 PspA/IM30 family protein [Streptomyces sp. SID4940]MYT63295.1 PspA/IM30 family protein [Streptomyces sp. SID8357]MYT88429.1 PspA/IM30 family protein [Streptomyces sp. SID8360]
MTKQTVLGRVTQLARADVNALLDLVEDPREMLDRLIRAYTATIAEAEQALAVTIGTLRLTEEDHRQDVEAAQEWGRKALAASRKADELRAGSAGEQADRFDGLAKVALGRQLHAEREAKTVEPSIASQTVVVEKLRAGLDRMKATLSELTSERDEPAARAASAHARNRRTDAVGSVDVMDPMSELHRFDEKVRREEARAVGRHEPAASSLDAQFEELDSLGDSAEIEARLAALKSGT